MARIRRRLRLLAALRGAAWGLAAATVVRFAGGNATSFLFTAMVTTGLVAIGAVVGALLAQRVHVATLVERRAPASRNLVFTAAELIGGPQTTSAHVSSRVLNDATAFTSRLDLRTLVPARGTIVTAAVAVILW